MRRVLIATLVIAIMATARPGTTRAQPSSLEVTLAIERTMVAYGETLQFTVSVHNPTNEVITAAFPSARRFDVVIASSAGELTRWSTSRFFAQVFRQESWLPGETMAHTDIWLPLAPFNPAVLGAGVMPPLPPGIYRIWAELPVLGRPLVSPALRLIIARPVALPPGCTAFAAGLPGGEWLPLLATLVQPYSALGSVWRYDSSSGAYTALSPDAGAPSDLVIVLPNDLLMFCMKADAVLHLPW